MRQTQTHESSDGSRTEFVDTEDTTQALICVAMALLFQNRSTVDAVVERHIKVDGICAAEA